MYENGESVSENEFSQAHPCFSPSNFSMGIEQLGLNIDTLSSHIPTQYIQEMGHDLNNSLPYEMPYTSFSTQNTNSQEENLQFIDMQNGHHSYLNAASLTEFMSIYPQSLLTKSASPFMNQQLNPENLTLGSEFLESNIYGNGSSLIGVGAERDVWEYEIGEGSNKVGSKGKCIITKTKEKIRREQNNDKYKALRNLLPNPDKSDKASIIGETIDHIKELLRTKSELRLLLEQKIHSREKNKRQKKTHDAEDESYNIKLEHHDGSSTLRSSWLHRKSKEIEVDVRIIDDDVTIKLAQKKKTNCLLIVSKALNELQLDIHHVAGGLVGDNFSFLFNTKICEGSFVYASAIASKIIEVVDKQYAAT